MPCCRFERRAKSFTGIWCCIDQKPVGHIWYDMFWDVIPHEDKHNRLIDKPWQPLVGP